MKFEIRWKTAEDFGLLRGTSTLTRIKHFWRKGWTEVPVVMASTIASALSIVMVAWVIRYRKTHDMTPKYYKLPRIYRPDDPAVKKIKHTSSFDL